MRIMITGGTGMIGRRLIRSLLADGNQVWVLTRNPLTARLPEGVLALKWDGRSTSGWGELASRMDGIVNLAGENIGADRWTAARKQRILDSRVQAGKAVTEAILHASPRPKVLVQASAIGYYGPRDSQPVSEESAPYPLSNADFGRTIAKMMRRPYWLPAPAFALRLLLGEMSTLVLDGAFVRPTRLLELGFRFRFEQAEEALSDLFL